ncbi:ArsR family transcriptional regulator [Sphingomonas parva]|uniref:ArsR family transcriptional regulator n=1 Tax=Sphingomonas parva TaxID=2555898 RepID=A0A4Y8ZML1_9SPHN|nr:transcriptional regulator [Sphingomonas parva]TFI57231.1 ArsR family transcriptional regulator [Sphingomonas parva]
MPPHGLDAVIHAPVRLQICAMLSATDEAEFALLRDETGVSESVLSKHLKQLEDAGYVTLRKATVASRQRTWAGLTRKGRAAFAAHVEALNRLVRSEPAAAGVLETPDGAPRR